MRMLNQFVACGLLASSLMARGADVVTVSSTVEVTTTNPTLVVSAHPPGEVPNPFVKPCVYHESLGAQWRHTFHHMRRTWDTYFEVYPKELANFEPTTLERIRAEPGFYLDKNVQIDLYMGRAGSFYRPFLSPFQEEGYANFSAWAYGTELWQKEAREQVGLLFYVDRRRKNVVDRLNELPMYTPVHVWATERSKTDGVPWIEIKGVEVIPETALLEVTLKHLELGTRQMLRKRYELAAQALGRALELQLPVNVEARAWALLGRSYFELRQFDNARNAYAEAVLRDDALISSLIFLARADEQLSNYAEAKEASEHAVTLAPSNPEARAELGLALAMLGDTRAGLKELEFAQKLAPRNQLPEANRNRALIYIRDNRLELAKAELSQAVVLRANDPMLHMELGEVELSLKQFEEAKREFGFAKELAPTRPEPYLKYALIARIQGDILKREGKSDEAKKAYLDALENVRQSLKYDDTDDRARHLEIEMLRELGREKEAERFINSMLDRNPNSAEAFDQLYANAVRLGKWDVMEDAASKAVKLAPTSVRMGRLANVYASRPVPDYKLAAATYESAVGADAANGSAWLELAQIRLALNDAPGAIVAADMAGNIMKTPEPRLLALRARLEQTPFDPSAVDVARTLAADAKDDLVRAQAQALLGGALLLTDNVNEAVLNFAKAEPMLKENADFQYWYGMALLKQKNDSPAKAHLKSAMEYAARSPQTVLQSRVQQKALDEILKLDPSFQAALPEPGRIIEGSTTTVTKETTKAGDKPIRKILPPIIEDDGPQPIPTELPRPK